MVLLGKQQLIELDRKIDDAIPYFELLSYPRDVALIHLLRFFEDYGRIYALKSPRSADPQVYAATLKSGQDAMQFAVIWIYQHCPLASPKTNLGMLKDAYVQAGQLHEAAMRYSNVWDLMALLQRGRAVGEVEGDGIVRLRFSNSEAEDVEVASYLVAPPDDPSLRDDIYDIANELHPATFLEDVIIRRHASGTIKYYVPDEVFGRVADQQRRLLSSKWELGAAWDLGGYTFAQFREFWVALLTFSFIHGWVCMNSGTKGGALNDVVKVLQRRGWEEKLAGLSGLSNRVVGLILDDVTYDAELYEEGKKQPDVTCQPFFPLRSQLLALSNQLVMLSNAERNLWDLISVVRPEIHSVLRNEKEGWWLRHLTPRLESYGLKVLGPIKFAHNGRPSDLDLLIIDSNLRFGLGCQLKWLTHPDRIRDVKYADDELLKGVKQAELSLEWLNSRTSRLQDLTGITMSDLATYDFKAAVVSKNTLGSSWTYKPGIPILSERLLDWVLGAPHHKSLRALWEVGEERRYMPQRGKHFIDEDSTVEFGGVRFVGEKTSMRVKKAWNPAEDIDLSGLH